MNTYQIDTSISEKGIIKLPEMPYLFNKKVKLIIISQEEKSTDIEQKKQAMDKILKMQETMSIKQCTDEELDDIRYEYLKEKYL